MGTLGVVLGRSSFWLSLFQTILLDSAWGLLCFSRSGGQGVGGHGRRAGCLKD